MKEVFKLLLIIVVLCILGNTILSNLGDGSKYVSNQNAVISCAPGFPSGFDDGVCWDGGWDYWSHLVFVNGLGYVYTK